MGSTASSASSEAAEPDFPARHSALYREFQAERAEILRHKWLESEKQGFDIGFEHALFGWAIRHRKGWRKHRADELAVASC
jgi:hypothetical protein